MRFELDTGRYLSGKTRCEHAHHVVTHKYLHTCAYPCGAQSQAIHDYTRNNGLRLELDAWLWAPLATHRTRRKHGTGTSARTVDKRTCNEDLDTEKTRTYHFRGRASQTRISRTRARALRLGASGNPEVPRAWKSVKVWRLRNLARPSSNLSRLSIETSGI